MKILLDECLPLDFRHSFPGHNAHTAQWAGLKSKKNGELLRAAEVAGHDVLLTVDQGIRHQLNPVSRKLSIILVRSRTHQIGQWCGPDDAFFKVRADDRNLYILRRSTSRDEWTLQSFRQLND